ncbi:hypothetical protein BDU57DRAFT_91313 [Ampelomyces quisqualis]|uniref:Uncharacterized protein n=1 Tax=Ampelomyces quisqualis TaxID=50730 RepID=A0A6A5Q980_AMPQU|nr:hypothetical protein BDU57DRAFT_91313 [Ampelomyces quisqualis]
MSYLPRSRTNREATCVIMAVFACCPSQHCDASKNEVIGPHTPYNSYNREISWCINL